MRAARTSTRCECRARAEGDPTAIPTRARAILMEDKRPRSEQPSKTTPEAQAINQWFSDLSYYESTLEQMAASKLDDSFREELRAIEQWFVVLSDPERTAALYSLIKHTTPMQQRFFITVLQQLSGKDISSVPTTTTPQITTTFVKHSSTPAPVKGTDMDLLTIATGNSLRLSLEPKTPVDAAIAQADWSQQPTPQLSTDPVRLSPIIQPRTFSAHPGDGWAHVNLASTGRSVSKGAVSGSDFSDYDEFGHVNGSTGTGAGASGKEKGKIPEVVDLALLNGLPFFFKNLLRLEPFPNRYSAIDIPSWLRSLRLHKYEFAFQNCTWRDMVKMSDAELARRGVTTVGARTKLLKVFEMVKAECAKSLIPI
ncbi:Flap-structured DNA-binding and RNA-binding protein [Entophlyctis luteolus]|nr:Flap-structured DNA-binding and RNA-binding protein [Entophlyctis luteolus]